jgi:hypothetical protein
MIPAASTTIAVHRLVAPQTDAYPDAERQYTTVATGVRAHFQHPQGIGQPPAGQRSVVSCRLACDPCDLAHLDVVRDETTGTTWHVEWVKTWPGPFPHHVCGVHEIVAEVEVGSLPPLDAHAEGASVSSGRAAATVVRP